MATKKKDEDKSKYGTVPEVTAALQAELARIADEASDERAAITQRLEEIKAEVCVASASPLPATNPRTLLLRCRA